MEDIRTATEQALPIMTVIPAELVIGKSALAALGMPNSQELIEQLSR
jgi:hypothetical protein